MKENIKKHKNYKFPSELRYDLGSKDWVVVATGRAKKPEMFKKEKKERERMKFKKDCPFCQIQTQENPTLIFSNGKEIPFESWKNILNKWSTIVVPNKYPAFLPYPKLEEKIEGGLFYKMNAVGFHEVVITKDHNRQIANFSVDEVYELFNVYQKRYVSLMKEKFVNYVSIFHNHGHQAGASIVHPHSQIITTPLIDTDLRKALSNANSYSKEKNECIYCLMNKWEMKTKKRIIFENKDFIALCPFASKTAFEVIVSPKKHLSYFEEITESQMWNLSEAFGTAIKKIYKGLNDPDYNFYLHSAPCDGKDHSYYHWHWTILPKTSIWAGFEIGTKIEISTIEPEKAAQYLRKQ